MGEQICPLQCRVCLTRGLWDLPFSEWVPSLGGPCAPAAHRLPAWRSLFWLPHTVGREHFRFFFVTVNFGVFIYFCSPLELGILMLRIVLYLAGRGPIRLKAISLVQIWWVCYYYRLLLSALAPESASFPGAQVSFSGMKAVAGSGHSHCYSSPSSSASFPKTEQQTCSCKFILRFSIQVLPKKSLILPLVHWKPYFLVTLTYFIINIHFVMLTLLCHIV